MKKDIEEEYLDIITIVDDKFGVHDVPSKAESLPKIASNNEIIETEAPRKPLASRRQNELLTNTTEEADYESAELPIMKGTSVATTYISKEKPKEKTVSEVKKKIVNEHPKKKHSPKKIFNFAIIGIFIFVAVYCATKMNLWSDENEVSDNQMKEIQNMIVERVVEPVEERDEKPNDTQIDVQNPKENVDYSKLALVDVDFRELVKVNPDTVAYIKINGLDVSAPIVQTSDNDFYLTHSFDKKANSAGWIFGDYRNDWNDLKDNTIIYGHNRKNYAMFGSLKLILEDEWNKNKDNHFVYISTATANMVFQMFSAYTIPTESYYLKNEFSSKEKYGEFLETLVSRSQVGFETSVTSEDKILTLSTCYTNTSKTVVHAKLVKIQEK